MTLESLKEVIDIIISKHGADTECKFEALDNKSLILYGINSDLVIWEEFINSDGSIIEFN